MDTKENTYYYNYKKLINTVKEINWNNYENINDPNNIINSMIKNIQSCIGMAKYTKPKKHISNKIPRNDWIRSAIINSCNTKEKLYNRLKHNPDNYELKNKYKTFCKNLTDVIKAAKTKYDKSLIEKNSSDPRKLWACINNKIGRNKNKSDTTIKQIKNESNTIIKTKLK